MSSWAELFSPGEIINTTKHGRAATSSLVASVAPYSTRVGSPSTYNFSAAAKAMPAAWVKPAQPATQPSPSITKLHPKARTGLLKLEPALPSICVGFIALDSSMSPIMVNRMAAEILSFPQKPEGLKRLGGMLVSRIRSMLLSKQPKGDAPVVSGFRSGKRYYSCRSFRVDSFNKGYDEMSIAILLERGASEAVSVVQAAEKYRLTAREQEVLRYLLDGLTSKEIADRMSISPKTVKGFLRLIMVKMGVSTRSGIVGRAVSSKA